MAWNKYYIFIKSPSLTTSETILAKLNLEQFKPKEEVPLHFSNKPQTLFTGFYKDSFLIVHPDIAFHFFGEKQSDTEKLFVDAFPDSEIAVLVENSTVGLYGYAIIDNGKKVRMKNGCDGEVYYDQGDLLPEEKEIFAKKIFDDETLEEMRSDGMSEEEIQSMINHEASWRVPNLLTKRYLGETVNAIDTSKIILTKYE